MALNSDLVGDPCLRKLLHRVDTRRVVHDRNDGWNLVVQMISFAPRNSKCLRNVVSQEHLRHSPGLVTPTCGTEWH